jgi:hypothetical protein
MLDAVFPDTTRYHLTRADAGRTLCGLPTKGQRRGVVKRLPSARVTSDRPPSYMYGPCLRCEEQARTSGPGRDMGR